MLEGCSDYCTAVAEAQSMSMTSGLMMAGWEGHIIECHQYDCGSVALIDVVGFGVAYRLLVMLAFVQ